MIYYYFSKPNRLAHYNVIFTLGKPLLLRNTHNIKETIMYEKHEVRRIGKFLLQEGKKFIVIAKQKKAAANKLQQQDYKPQ